MKKYILAIVAAIMVVGRITFVACDKNNESSQTISSSFSNMKGRATADNLLNALVSYFTVCDSAYHSDSTTFLSACQDIGVFGQGHFYRNVVFGSAEQYANGGILVGGLFHAVVIVHIHLQLP